MSSSCHAERAFTRGVLQTLRRGTHFFRSDKTGRKRASSVQSIVHAGRVVSTPSGKPVPDSANSASKPLCDQKGCTGQLLRATTTHCIPAEAGKKGLDVHVEQGLSCGTGQLRVMESRLARYVLQGLVANGSNWSVRSLERVITHQLQVGLSQPQKCGRPPAARCP